MARRTLRVTAAVTGMAALGAGIAGTAFAGEPSVHNGEGMQLASIDGFDSESVVPSNQLSADFAKALTGGSSKAPTAASTASPTDSLTSLQGFQFEMPPTEMGTAGEAGTFGLEPAMGGMFGGSMPGAANKSATNNPDKSDFAQQNGLPGPVNGPANGATSPATSQAMPAMAMMMSSMHDATTNNDATSNHSFTF